MDPYSVAIVTEHTLSGIEQKFRTTLKVYDYRILSIRLSEQDLSRLLHNATYGDYLSKRRDFARTFPGWEGILKGPHILFVNKSSWEPIDDDDFDEDAVFVAIRQAASEPPTTSFTYASGVKYNIGGTITTLPLPVVDFHLPRIVPRRLQYPRAKSSRTKTVGSRQKRPCPQRPTKEECLPPTARRHGCRWSGYRCLKASPPVRRSVRLKHKKRSK